MTMQMTQGAQPTGIGLDMAGQRLRSLLGNADPLNIARILMKRMRAVFAAYAMARRERKNIRELRMLDDQTLADIGLTRGGIASSVRESLARTNRARS